MSAGAPAVPGDREDRRAAVDGDEEKFYISGCVVVQIAMAEKTDDLRDIFVEVAGSETVTESQREDVSRDPVDSQHVRVETEVPTAAREDGLSDAISEPEPLDQPA